MIAEDEVPLREIPLDEIKAKIAEEEVSVTNECYLSAEQWLGGKARKIS